MKSGRRDETSYLCKDSFNLRSQPSRSSSEVVINEAPRALASESEKNGVCG